MSKFVAIEAGLLERLIRMGGNDAWRVICGDEEHHCSGEDLNTEFVVSEGRIRPLPASAQFAGEMEELLNQMSVCSDSYKLMRLQEKAYDLVSSIKAASEADNG